MGLLGDPRCPMRATAQQPQIRGRGFYTVLRYGSLASFENLSVLKGRTPQRLGLMLSEPCATHENRLTADCHVRTSSDCRMNQYSRLRRLPSSSARLLMHGTFSQASATPRVPCEHVGSMTLRGHVPLAAHAFEPQLLSVPRWRFCAKEPPSGGSGTLPVYVGAQTIKRLRGG